MKFVQMYKRSRQMYKIYRQILYFSDRNFLVLWGFVSVPSQARESDPVSSRHTGYPPGVDSVVWTNRSTLLRSFRRLAWLNIPRTRCVTTLGRGEHDHDQKLQSPGRWLKTGDKKYWIRLSTTESYVRSRGVLTPLAPYRK